MANKSVYEWTLEQNPGRQTFVWIFLIQNGLKQRDDFSPLLSKIFGPKRDEVTEKWRSLRNEEFKMICTHHQTLFGRSNRDEWDRRSM